MSKAAWGSYEKNNTQLFIRSYELGVVLFPDLFKNDLNDEVVLLHASPEEISTSTFKNTNRKPSVIVPVRLPYDLPLTHYNSADEPWRWDNPSLIS